MLKITKSLLELDSLPIYLAGHLKPDQDSICSCLALAKFLTSLNKKAYVLIEKKDMDLLDWKKDYSLICSEVNDIEYNFIALDLNEKSRLGIYEKDFDNAKFKINIDHHQNNKYEANLTHSKPSMSSTCEIIYQIISSYSKTSLTKDICEYLYSGILNDTNCFSRRLSNKTLTITQELINHDIDYIHILKETYSKRSLYEFKALAKLVNEIQYDGFHYVIIDKQKEEFNKLTHNQIVKKIAEDLRKIEDIDIFILLIKNDDLITGKCMTNKCEIANKIAELFNGGGHKKEAGFTIKESIENILKTIKTYLKNPH